MKVVNLGREPRMGSGGRELRSLGGTVGVVGGGQ